MMKRRTEGLRTLEERKKTLRRYDETAAKRIKIDVKKSGGDKTGIQCKKLVNAENKDMNEGQLMQFQCEIANLKQDRVKHLNELEALKIEFGKVQTENEEVRKLKAQAIQDQNEIDNAKREREKVEEELEALKIEYGKVQTENEEVRKLKAQAIQDQNEIDNAKREREKVEEELEALKIEFGKVQTEYEEMRKLKPPVVENQNAELSNTIDRSVDLTLAQGECDCSMPLLLTTLKESINPSNQQCNSLPWRKVGAVKQYKDAELKLKKFLASENKLVNYLVGHIYEDKVEPFIRESMKLIFRKEFFLKCTSYKIEVGKAYLRDSKILECLIKSIKNKLAEKATNVPCLTLLIQNTISKLKADVKRSPSLWEEDDEEEDDEEEANIVKTN